MNSVFHGAVGAALIFDYPSAIVRIGTAQPIAEIYVNGFCVIYPIEWGGVQWSYVHRVAPPAGQGVSSQVRRLMISP